MIEIVKYDGVNLTILVDENEVDLTSGMTSESMGNLATVFNILSQICGFRAQRLHGEEQLARQKTQQIIHRGLN